MGIFLEEVMSQTRTNTNVNMSEVMDLRETVNELLNEKAEMLCEMLNDEILFTESFFDDFKVKKEDLADPNKVKAIIKKIEAEGASPTTKCRWLNILYDILISMVVGLALSPVAGTTAGTARYQLAALTGNIISFILRFKRQDRLNTLIKKTEKAIKQLEKKGDNEKIIKSLKNNLETLKKAKNDARKLQS